jgi:hypothetical protein
MIVLGTNNDMPTIDSAIEITKAIGNAWDW